jgi:enoyl-CoA hydratase/carnithine racemase
MGRLWDAIASCRKPVIAAVKGYALGGGCELAMHADIIVAGEGARFGQPEILIGLMPGGGATQRLTRAVGKHRAMLMMLTGEPVTAAEALQMGLASRVVEDGAVEAEALRLAEAISGHPVLAVRSIKDAVLAGMDATLSTGLEIERKSFQLLFATPEKTEGIRARLEKRPPKYR